MIADVDFSLGLTSDFIVLAWCLFVLSTITVIIRLYVQLQLRRRPWRELFVVAAWSLYLIKQVCENALWMIYYKGNPPSNVDIWPTLTNLDATIFLEVFYACKASLICLYLDLAPRHHYPLTWWCIIMSAVFIAFAAVSNLFQHIYFDWLYMYWTFDKHQVVAHWDTMNMVLHLYTDVQVLVIPFPILWYLPIDRREKFAACCVFALGLLNVGCATAVVIWYTRPWMERQSNNHTIFLNEVQLATALMVICLPYCRPLWRLWRRRTTSTIIELEHVPPQDPQPINTPSPEHVDVEAAVQVSMPENELVGDAVNNRPPTPATPSIPSGGEKSEQLVTASSVDVNSGPDPRRI